jgi:sec-independent protein translocase protein TatA
MNHLLFLDAPELIVIALVFLLLFGGKKIPELMKGLGKGVRSFKEGLNDVENEIKDATKDVKKEDKTDSAKKDE